MNPFAYRVVEGDCLDVLRDLPDACIDAVVTDPPYGLTFMGRDWDRGVPGAVFWTEILRVAKPGAHLVAFGGTRTYHRLACAIEDAGWEIRDSLHWMYGTGFPKSLDVSKAIDKAAGAEREVVGAKITGKARTAVGWQGGQQLVDITAPATDAAKQWDGWGTALKPAHEPVVLARKPLAGTVAANVLAHGTGALNVDGCRVGIADADRSVIDKRSGAGYGTGHTVGAHQGRDPGERFKSNPAGRWPPNVLLSHAPDCGDECVPGCPVRELGEQSGERTSGSRAPGVRKGLGYRGTANGDGGPAIEGSSGTAARFFPRFRYVAKASKKERGEGNNHPTVKPVALMRWLVRLVTPPGGLVLDPFAGSGTTGVATVAEGRRCFMIEKESEYAEIIKARMECANRAEED